MNPRITTALVATALILVIAAWTTDPNSGLGAWIWLGLILTLAALTGQLLRPRHEPLAPWRYPGGDL